MDKERHLTTERHHGGLPGQLRALVLQWAPRLCAA